MPNYILFSEPGGEILEKIKPHLFLDAGMTVACMMSDGGSPKNLPYMMFWRDYVEKNGAKYEPSNDSQITT